MNRYLTVKAIILTPLVLGNLIGNLIGSIYIGDFRLLAVMFISGLITWGMFSLVAWDAQRTLNRDPRELEEERQHRNWRNYG